MNLKSTVSVISKSKAWLIGAGLVLSTGVVAIPPGTSDEIEARLQAFGEVCRVGDDCGTASAAASSGPLSGQQVYDQFCFACHSTGVGGAPKIGEAGEWAARVDKGMDVLMDSTLNGLNAMPAKGTCMNCSDEELSEAVTYMLDASS
ncbi:MAG: c-type cytochrome [Pseudomonadota bacterium]